MSFLAGSTNHQFGIYKSECCEDEFVLYPGITFPNCKKHREMVTRWVLISAISIGPVVGDINDAGGSGGGNRGAHN